MGRDSAVKSTGRSPGGSAVHEGGFDCLVIGSGPAGLGTAAMLNAKRVRALIVERAPMIAAAWVARYDGFRLNTSSWFSYLPGRRFARAAGRWPSREALVAYYQGYADRHGLAVQLETTVSRVERADDGWRLLTDRGDLDAPFVVVATGKYRTPTLPDWPGRNEFGGEILHSADYRNAEAYRRREVLVVGPGNSGCEIALQLERRGASPVRLSVRTPPHIFHRDVGPFPTDLFAVLGRRLPVRLVDAAGELARRVRIGDLSPYGLPPPRDGVYTRLRRTGMIPTVDGAFLRAVRERRIEVVPAVERFEREAVVLEDGSRLSPEVVIAATGYRRDLEPLVGHLGVLGQSGHPLVHGAQTHPRAPGLHFIGFSEPLSGNMREIRFDARRIARAIAREREELPAGS
jgi:putative flavoprotein involved in K+ transport